MGSKQRRGEEARGQRSDGAKEAMGQGQPKSLFVPSLPLWSWEGHKQFKLLNQSCHANCENKKPRTISPCKWDRRSDGEKKRPGEEATGQRSERAKERRGQRSHGAKKRRGKEATGRRINGAKKRRDKGWGPNSDGAKKWRGKGWGPKSDGDCKEGTGQHGRPALLGTILMNCMLA